MNGLKSRMEMIEEESVNLKIDSYNLFNLKNRKEKANKKERNFRYLRPQNT